MRGPTPENFTVPWSLTCPTKETTVPGIFRSASSDRPDNRFVTPGSRSARLKLTSTLPMSGAGS